MKTSKQKRNAQVVAIDGKLTVISTFAGTGGSSLGYKWAGFKELLAIDFDAHAVECFRANFPEVPIWHKSVTDVTGKEIMDFCGIKWGELDILDGSPPCQGFSTAGKRKVRDPRNDLFQHYWRLVTELQPKVFVMENVSGMIKGTMKGKYLEIWNTLISGNYNVKSKLMNAMYYNVPQSRQRIIFIGVRKDLNKEPIYPLPNNKVITVKEAFKGLSDKEIIICENEYWYKCKVGNNFSSVHPKGHYFSSTKLNPSRPSPTITKTTRIDPSCGIWHWNVCGHISINMAKRLCSFPDDFILTGKYIEQWARLGNAVMPNMMKAIAETIKKEILDQD